MIFDCKPKGRPEFEQLLREAKDEMSLLRLSGYEYFIYKLAISPCYELKELGKELLEIYSKKNN